ncbi:MAG: ankyrin repeat domain-containing protein [Elusimicrobiaceae bacterium]|nr:ankyrin repeat domain-containing protein [Elusimicrobiaceae bacterium]
MRKKLFFTLVAVLGVVLPALTQDMNKQLCVAAFCGDTPRVQRLIGQGADIEAKDKRGWTPLGWAVSQGYPDTVKLLLDNGADIDKRVNGASPLIWATLHERADMVRILLRYHCNVNARDNFNNTALDYALIGRNDQILELLLEHGAHVTPHVIIGTPKDRLKKLFEIKLQKRIKTRLSKELHLATEAGTGYTSR